MPDLPRPWCSWVSAASSRSGSRPRPNVAAPRRASGHACTASPCPGTARNEPFHERPCPRHAVRGRRTARPARRRRLSGRHVRRRRLRDGIPRGGALHGVGDRSRSRGDRPRRQPRRALPRPAAPDPRPVRRHAGTAGAARRHRAGRRGAGPRRVVVPARRSGPRLLVPRRWPAGHAHETAAGRPRPIWSTRCPSASWPICCSNSARNAPLAASPAPSSRPAPRRPMVTTARLAAIIRGVLPPDRSGIDPATRSFQALRIRVNDELGEIERALEQAGRLLAPAGRLIVVSFHSLEDRIVKRFMIEAAGRAPSPSRHDPRGLAARPAPRFRLLTARPLRPGAGGDQPPTRVPAAPGCAHWNARWRGARHDPPVHLRLLPAGLRLRAVPLPGQASRADDRSRDREDRARHRRNCASRPGCCTPNGRCRTIRSACRRWPISSST